MEEKYRINRMLTEWGVSHVIWEAHEESQEEHGLLIEIVRRDLELAMEEEALLRFPGAGWLTGANRGVTGLQGRGVNWLRGC